MNQETIKILFIEGLLKDLDLTELISGEKVSINIKLIRANNLLEAKKLISKEQIDVIVSDIRLTDNAGLDIIDQIKINFPELPIIALSDVEDLSLERAIIQKGVQDCLSVKQLNTLNLIRSISYAIERKKNELKQHEKEFSVETITAPFYLINSDATIEYVNEETCNYLGYTKKELLSMTIFDFDETFNRECWDKHWQNLKEKGSEIVETIHKTKDGHLVNVEINANYFELDGQEFNFAYGFNTTEKKKISENLQFAIKELSNNKKEAIKLFEPTLKENIISSLTSKNHIGPINLLDLVDLKDLQKIQDTFATANEVASMIIDLDGNAITKPSNFCDVCKLVRQTEKGQQQCARSDKSIGEKALEKMEPYFESCHSCGFIDASAPIIVDGKTIAHWLIGQSNVADVNNDRIIAYAEEIGADKDQMLEAYSKMSNMSLDRFKKITELLWLLAQEISNKGYKNLQLAQELKKVRETEQSLKQSINDLQDSEKKLEDKQKELVESQALLNSVIDQAPVGVLVCKAPDMELYVTNKAANEITGLKTKKWITITLNNIDLHYENFYPDRTPYRLEDLPLPRAIRDKEVIQNEEIILRLSDGSEKWVSVNASPVYDNNDKLIAATAVFADITERKKLEEELLSQNKDLQAKEEELLSQNEELQAKEEELTSQNEEILEKQNELIESQALLESVVNQAPTGVFVGKAPDMQICIINKAAAEISGLPIESWEKININKLDLNYESFYPDGRKYELKDLPLPRALRDEEVIQNEEIILKLADGREKWALVNASPVYDTNNNLIAATAVILDITERKKLEEELVNHRNNLEKEIQERTEALNTVVLHLEQANKHKNQFISSMSHELRTPLNAIIGFTQTLQKEYFGDLNEKQMEYIGLVKSSGEHLLSLINDILNLAKIDSGSVEFTPENIKAEKYINEIVSIMAAQFKDKKIHLDYSIDDDIDLFYSDERKCKQILFNLLSNALKYTNEGGRVNINAFKEGEFVCIEVEDDGIGIKENDIEKVFQEFYQSDETRDQALGGAGIGLALTKRLVKMHGGEIGVESQLNKGSKFWFTVPAKNHK